jgi:soluble lytic murein transglycosylase
MQIMPATARGIASGLGVYEYDLKDPCTSLRFGTRYIAGLLSMFKGNFDFVVAGYNAGAGNVQKWRARMAGEDSDYFTEFIPFSETRYYVVRTRKFLIQYGIINRRP